MKTLRHNHGEQGQTIVLVALSLLALLSMAALAIDVANLYVASTEAQQAADAAALAGAKVFVTSGYTSYPPGFGNNGWVCNGSTGLADYAAQSALAANTVAGVAPTMTTSCDFTQNENPTITVRVQRTGLPIFFARIWRVSSPSVSATAKAEAYNPSGGTASIATGIVKPFLLPNCLPSTTGTQNSNCGTYYYVNPMDGSIASGIPLGSTQTWQLPDQSTAPFGLPTPNSFYPIDFSTYPPTPACPVSSISACNNQTGNFPYYFDNIFCSNSNQLKCGDLVGGSTNNPVDTRFNGTNWNALQARLDKGIGCLIHSSSITSGACTPGAFAQDCFVPQGPGEPPLIRPGSNNPDLALRSMSYISRSDSIVTVPLFDGRNLCWNSNPGGPCNYTAPIVGFLQLGIIQDDLGTGSFDAIILNASGCNPSASGQTVTGGNISSIPVRLVQSQ